MAKKTKQDVLVSYKFLPIFEELFHRGMSDMVAKLIIAIIKYDMDGTPPDFAYDPGISILWESVIKPVLDTNKKRYEETVKARQEAGRNGGIRKAENSKNIAKLPNGSKSNQTSAKLPDNDDDVDVDIDNNNLINPNGLIVTPSCDPLPKFGRHQPIVDAWNSLPLPNIITLKGTRLKLLNARIKEYGEDEVIHAITMIRNSKFLQGQNGKGWYITFDWLIKPNNFGKVLEGIYDDRQGSVDAVPNGKNDAQAGYQKLLGLLGEE